MIVAGGADVVAGADIRAGHHGHHMAATVGDVVGRLIEDNHQQPAGLELGGVEQGTDVGLQPAVGSLEPTAQLQSVVPPVMQLCASLTMLGTTKA